jgi:ferredoxin
MQKNFKMPSRCKAPQSCKECKAYVDRSYWVDTPNGGWAEIWEECAFGHVKLTEEEYQKVKEKIEQDKNTSRGSVSEKT